MSHQKLSHTKWESQADDTTLVPKPETTFQEKKARQSPNRSKESKYSNSIENPNYKKNQSMNPSDTNPLEDKSNNHSRTINTQADQRVEVKLRQEIDDFDGFNNSDGEVENIEHIGVDNFGDMLEDEEEPAKDKQSLVGPSGDKMHHIDEEDEDLHEAHD